MVEEKVFIIDIRGEAWPEAFGRLQSRRESSEHDQLTKAVHFRRGREERGMRERGSGESQEGKRAHDQNELHRNEKLENFRVGCGGGGGWRAERSHRY